MTEESINVPITPEIVIPDGVRSRNSEGKLIGPKGRATKQTDPRRASTGSFRSGGKKLSSEKPSPLNNGNSIVPHYLRASTGSCHDFCKYGKKLETEVKPWQAKARKVIKPTLNHQNGLEYGDLSEKTITQVAKSKPHVSNTNSFRRSAVSEKKTSSPSNKSTIPSRPVSAQGKIMTVNEKKTSSPSNKSTIPSRPVSAQGKIMTMNEKKQNVLEIRNTSFVSGRRETKTKPDKTKETSKEATRNLVSFPVVKRATKPSYNGDSSLKAKAKKDKELLLPLNNQNKSSKAELKHPTDYAGEEKTLHVIKVGAINTTSEAKETNQEGIKETEKEIVEHKNSTDEALPVLEVDSEKLAFNLKHNGNTFDPPSFELFSSAVKSPSLSYGEEETQDEVGYKDGEKKVLESKQNEKTFDSPKSDSFTSPDIPSPVISPALSCGEEESQDELENTSEERIPELKHNESTYSPPSESFSPPNISSPVKSPALSDSEEEAQDEVECTTNEKNIQESKQIESTFESSPSESFASPNIISIIKSPALSYGEEEASDEVENTNSEKNLLDSKPKESTIDSPPSESFSSCIISSTVPALLYGEEETQDEVESTNSEKKVPELKQNESTVASIPSLVESSALLYAAEETRDEVVYENPNSEKKVLESKQNESTVASIPSLIKSSALLHVDEESQDKVVYLDEIYGSDDSISETSEILYSDEEETSVENHNSKTRKAKSVSIDDDKATKLKFRRGKVIEIESNDTSPRRLKFRRAKIIGENKKNDSNSCIRSYEKRDVDINGTEHDSEKVVLRHQQVEGKKDAQGLFNNVIEETAIKLAETRKSKVKALVGAFETVISLQESKPSS